MPPGCPEDNSEELKALWQSISLLTGRVEMMEVGCCCGVCCFLGGRMSCFFLNKMFRKKSW